MKKNIINVSVVLLISIVGFVIGAIFMYRVQEYIPKVQQTIVSGENKVTVTDKGIADSVEKIYDSVVVITSSVKNQVVSSGTGFVYKKEGNDVYIITNNHVVDGGGEYHAIFNDGEKLKATLLGGDAFEDVAVIKLETDKEVGIATIGTSEGLRLGDTVFTVGAPVTTEYSGTVTRGIISGLDRLVSVGVSSQTSSDWMMKVIQTDAAINPGNSGGPLANINGEVIGVNTLKLVDAEVEGIGFAIPIEDVMQSVEILEKSEQIQRPFLGIGMLDIADTYQLFSLGIVVDKNITSGVVVTGVTNGTSAEKLGLKEGDVITHVGDKEVKNKAEFRYELYNYKAFDEVSFTFISNGKTLTKSVKLGTEN